MKASSAASAQPAALAQAPTHHSSLCSDTASGSGTASSRTRRLSGPGGFRGAFPPGADLDSRAICTANNYSNRVLVPSNMYIMQLCK